MINWDDWHSDSDLYSTDVTPVCHDDIIWQAHKGVLIAWSPIFTNILVDGNKTKYIAEKLMLYFSVCTLSECSNVQPLETYPAFWQPISKMTDLVIQIILYQGDLVTHQKSVHICIKYSCTLCDYKATKITNLTRHNKNKHINPGKWISWITP